jgi:DNA-binding PadR family transcriptional regulator
MMERKLLLLGLLRAQSMHGYQLSEVIDSHLGMSVQLKKATAYDLLSKMENDGWITFYEERAGNRPQRRVYTLTPAGEAAFQRLLRQALAIYQPSEFPGDISLAFLDVLSPGEAVALLRQRRTAIEILLDHVSEIEPHPGSVQLVIEHQIHHLTAELEWLDQVIQRTEARTGGDTG